MYLSNDFMYVSKLWQTYLVLHTNYIYASLTLWKMDRELLDLTPLTPWKQQYGHNLLTYMNSFDKNKSESAIK